MPFTLCFAHGTHAGGNSFSLLMTSIIFVLPVFWKGIFVDFRILD